MDHVSSHLTRSWYLFISKLDRDQANHMLKYQVHAHGYRTEILSVDQHSLIFRKIFKKQTMIQSMKVKGMVKLRMKFRFRLVRMK